MFKPFFGIFGINFLGFFLSESVIFNSHLCFLSHYGLFVSKSKWYLNGYDYLKKTLNNPIKSKYTYTFTHFLQFKISSGLLILKSYFFGGGGVSKEIICVHSITFFKERKYFKNLDKKSLKLWDSGILAYFFPVHSSTPIW